MLVYGHGDGDALNTLASFDDVRRLGADGVELDVRRTADDALVAIHDHLLPGGAEVAATRLDAVPAGITTLDRVLDACAGMTVNIEIKNHSSDPAFDPSERIADLVVELLEERRWSDDVIVSSFGMACIDRVRSLRPSVPTAALLLSRRPPHELLDPVVIAGHRIVHPYDTMVDQAFMAAAAQRSLTVNVWVGEDVATTRLAELAGLEVDGVITSSVGAALHAAGRSR